ncbi:MAG TPA: M24 family metallopeptidase [Flavobacteriales bacterium]|nr:M24 family metallopeptidase [Flavobacteriales bacterium]
MNNRTKARALRFLSNVTLIVGVLQFLAMHSNAQEADSIVPSAHFSNVDFEAPALDKEFHAKKREDLRAIMPENSAAIIFSSSIKNRSNDVDFEFHQDPNFFYLTGLNEPHAMLIVFKEEQRVESFDSKEILFIQPRDSMKEIWSGKTLGVDKAKELLGLKYVFASGMFTEFDFDFYKFDKVFYIVDHTSITDDDKNRRDLFSLKKHFVQMLDSTRKNVDLQMLKEFMATLREIKEPEEIALLRKAIEITCGAQHDLIAKLKPGMYEYQAEAIIEFGFKFQGAESPGFPSIIGGGKNSCILHYTSNRNELQDGELLVIDIGAEYHNYSADITRTLPINGKFTKEQKIIYNIVLDAQNAGIEACKKGNKFWAPNEASTKIIIQGLVQNGVIKKRMDYRKYFMHGTSHYLGLDVHDIGLNGSLAPGNVLTVEPGIYIPKGSDCDPKWWNIGIRIEDDILITKDGYEVLSDCVPKTITEIEYLMAK